MIKEFDGSYKMLKDIMFIDSKTFKDIDCDIDTLKKRIEKNRNYELYVKYLEDKPVGYLGILYMSNLHYDGGWIDLIAILEEYRNRGFGREFVKLAQERISKRGGKITTALVKESNLSSSNMLLKSDFYTDRENFFLYFKDLEK